MNCAGGGYHWYSFDDTSLEIIEEQFRFTVTSVYALVKAAAPHLLERPGASIINIGSVTIGKAPRATSPTRRPRPALVQMTKSLAADLGPKVRVNIIHPGATETEALHRGHGADAPRDARGHATTWPACAASARPRTSAPPRCILASAAGSYVTGFELTVAGGPVDEMNQMFPDL